MNKVSAKEAFGKIKPESVALVISMDESGQPNGMICSWFMKCSIEPPMIAVALSKKSHTAQMIKHSREFVIALANKELENEVKYFGSHHGDSFNKFEETGIETSGPTYVNSPLIKKASVNFECYLDQEIEIGDHDLFIGKIVASYSNENKKILFNVERIGNERYYLEL